MAIGVDGLMFCADNQGSWLPSSALYIMRPGAKYLHQETPTGKPVISNLVAWFPHGEIGNSPSEMTLIPDGAYRGQMLIGDVTHGGLKRVSVEKVAGEYQATLFRHSQGLEAGINRLAWAPDGSLIVGGIGSNGNWNHLGHKFGLQRLVPTGKVPFEFLHVSARRNGVLLTMTQPFGSGAEATLKKALIRQWRYEPTLVYGGDKKEIETLKVGNVQLSESRRQAFLHLEGVKAGRVLYVNARGCLSQDSDTMWSPEAWATVNRLPAMDWRGFGLIRDPMFVKRPAQAKTLIDPSGKTTMIHKDGKAAIWRAGRGFLEVVHDASASIGAADLFSREPHGDVMVHVEWLSPAGGQLLTQTNGNSGIKLQSRYEIQIMNSPGIPDVDDFETKFNEAGSIYRLTKPRFNVSFGAGVWQSYDIWFRQARWRDVKKVANARMTVYWNGVLIHDDQDVPAKTGMSVDESPLPLPLLLQDHATEADGGVRYRNVWWVRDPWEKGFPPPVTSQ